MPRVSGIVWYSSLSVRLGSLNVLPSRPIHVAEDGASALHCRVTLRALWAALPSPVHVLVGIWASLCLSSCA